jgi:hypothetical protein
VKVGKWAGWTKAGRKNGRATKTASALNTGATETHIERNPIIMATRNGKLAHLPNDIREQLNLRLLEGESGRELVAWLNALPEVQSILGAQFNGSPISEVNLTHWRQGGYLQWLTERECFDSARALAEADCGVDAIGLSAERLLNVLTVRFGQLLMRWDLPSDESESESVAFSQMAKKARILQGISRSLLAIHRIQSQSARKKSETAISSPNSHATTVSGETIPNRQLKAQPTGTDLPLGSKSAIRNPPSLPGEVLAEARTEASQSAIPKVLSGMIKPSSVSLNRAQRPFKADLDLSEVLEAV